MELDKRMEKLLKARGKAYAKASGPYQYGQLDLFRWATASLRQQLSGKALRHAEYLHRSKKLPWLSAYGRAKERFQT